ncbi:MAG: hypothetical protein U1E20_15975 [Methylocystis sp.]|uniref:hypothetical protein n=1 Tax=Methylocystis sp. TaxID=1911079 RepID=UPI003940139E
MTPSALQRVSNPGESFSKFLAGIIWFRTAASASFSVMRAYFAAVVLALAACITIASSRDAAADWLNMTGAETAPNFAEIDVLEDRARVTLEIDPADHAAFAPGAAAAGSAGAAPDLSRIAASPNNAFAVQADGEVRLIGNLVELDVRPRAPKPTAIRPAGMPAPPPGPPRSAEVIRAVFEFPFQGRPTRLSFAPPLDAKGRAIVSLGFLARHGHVPITDYRYLSQLEALRLDWNDPWYSAFENPNLARHHRSALMSFISIEPREVRHEIISRLRDLEGWCDLNLLESRTLAAAQIDSVKRAAARCLAKRNPMTIDGVAIEPAAVNVQVLDIGVAGLQIMEDLKTLDRAAALLGIILSYPQSRLPARLSVKWQLFPNGETTVPSWVADPAGGVPGQITPDVPEVSWTNYLKTWKDPVASPVNLDLDRAVRIPMLSALFVGLGAAAMALAFRRSRPWRWIGAAVAACLIAVVTLPLGGLRVAVPGGRPDEARATAISSAMIRNAAVAMLEIRPERFDAALAPFVSADAIGAVGDEMRRGLSVNLPSGAHALTESIGDVAVEKIDTRGEGLSLLATWKALVSGGHWGHMHRREIQFRALIDVAEADGVWKVHGLTILSARPST